MQSDDAESDAIDWSLTTWDGARREQMRRWSRMPLAEMILASYLAAGRGDRIITQMLDD